MDDEDLWARIEEAHRNLAYAEKAFQERPSDFARRHVEKARLQCDFHIGQWRAVFGDKSYRCPSAAPLTASTEAARS
jgi:hypothetical protein